MAVADPAATRERWEAVVGGLPDGVEFITDPEERGLIAVEIDRDGERVEVVPHS